MSRGKLLWVLVVVLAVLSSACGTTTQVADSPEERMERARQLARLAVAAGVLDRTLDRGASVAQEYSVDQLRLELKRELTEEENQQVFSILKSVLSEFLTPEGWEEALSEIYARHYTAGELEEILRFFQGTAGQKILRMETQMDREVSDAEEALLSERLEEFIDRADEELAAAFDLGPGAER